MMSDAEERLHRVGGLAGHLEDPDPYRWSFLIQWKNHDEQGMELLNEFMVDGSWKVENMISNYLKDNFGESKKLVKEQRKNRSKYSIWDAKKLNQQLKAGKLTHAKTLTAKSSTGPSSGDDNTGASNDGRKVEKIVGYAAQLVKVKWEDAGVDGATWEQIGEISGSAGARSRIREFLAEMYPAKKLAKQRDRDGEFTGYAVVDRA